MKLPRRVDICEVGTRDGFQIEPDWIPTETKIEVVNRLSATGLPKIEVTSFVSPKAVPALKDAEAVMAGITRRPGTVYAALVPNDKGAVRAVDAGVDVIHTVLSASESHNLANVNMSIAESLVKMRAVMEVAQRAGKPVYSGISCTFGCPFETDVPLDQLERVVGAMVGMGARGIGLADTTGMANPVQVQRVLERMIPRFPGVEWTLHTHDTRAMAIPNILAAMEMGVTHIDSSIGGLGGCPFAPGASGNVCTEDLVHCLHAMGVETGVDLDALVATSRRVQEIIGRTLPGQIVKAGKWDRRYPLPDGVQSKLGGPVTKAARQMLRLMDRAVTRWHIPVIGKEKGRVLRRLLARAKPRRGIEVGTLFGYSAIMIGSELGRGGVLTCVEQNAYLAKFAQQNADEAGLKGRVKVVVGDALRVLPMLRGRVDFLLLDANKEDYLDYLRAVEPRLVKGALVVADNTGIYRRDVKPYLDHVRSGGRYESREHDFGFDCMEVSVFRG